MGVDVDGLPAPVEGRPYPDDFTGINFIRLSVCFEGGCGGFPSAAFIVMDIGIDFKSMAMVSPPSPPQALAAAVSTGDLLVRSPRVNKGPRFCRLLLDDVPSSVIIITSVEYRSSSSSSAAMVNGSISTMSMSLVSVGRFVCTYLNLPRILARNDARRDK
jgi:hypothetical protein